MNLRLRNRSKLLLGLAALLLVSGVGVYAVVQVYMSTSFTVSVGSNLAVSAMTLQYDSNTVTPCSPGTGVTYVCPTPTGLTGSIYGGDTLAWAWLTSTGRPTGITPAISVDTGSYSASTTVTESYITCTGPSWTQCTGTPTSGIPATMSSGTTYEILVNLAVQPTAAAGSLTTAIQWGT